MAFQNKMIQNPKTGQSILFLQTAKDTGGKLLKMEATYRPQSAIPAEHYHPNQEEDFYVLKGELSVQINGQITTIKSGASIHIDRNVYHTMWNQSDDETIVRWEVRPALDTEYFFETMTGLACDGKTNEKGIPSFLQTILTIKKFSGVFRLSKPSFALQKVLFAMLYPVARLAGYKPFYKKYID